MHADACTLEPTSAKNDINTLIYHVTATDIVPLSSRPSSVKYKRIINFNAILIIGKYFIYFMKQCIVAEARQFQMHIQFSWEFRPLTWNAIPLKNRHLFKRLLLSLLLQLISNQFRTHKRNAINNGDIMSNFFFFTRAFSNYYIIYSK